MLVVQISLRNKNTNHNQDESKTSYYFATIQTLKINQSLINFFSFNLKHELNMSGTLVFDSNRFI